MADQSDKRMAMALQLRRMLTLLLQAAPLTEEDARTVADMYEPWAVGVKYSQGQIVKSGVDGNGDAVLYSVIQKHTSSANELPGDTPTLYKRIGFTETGIPLWTQPLGSSDAYKKGDVVSHNGVVWISDINKNVGEPGVYGWSKK